VIEGTSAKKSVLDPLGATLDAAPINTSSC
jgi:hypothetical protein